MLLFGIMRKTVKELRKNRCLTARELAFLLKTDTVEILRVKPLPPTLRLEAGASCFIDRSLKGLTQSPQA